MGVGNAEFDAMEELDADKGGLKKDGVKAARDIVQFVAFNNYNKLDSSVANLYLAKDVLAEVPKQFMDYMKLNGIVPKNKISPNTSPEIESLKIQ